MKTQLILDMPEQEYFSLKALSGSGIKLLRAGPLEYWYYTYGPGSEEESTAAQRAGSAKHKCGLEGLEAFRAVYVPAICKQDYEGVLDSQEDLKGWCRDQNLAVGGSKAVLCERISDAIDLVDNPPTLWMDEVAKQKADAETNDQEILSQDEYKDALSKAKQITPIIDELRNEGGRPEVSILWEQCGILCKSRIDFLAPGTVFDLKNVQNSNRLPFADLVSKAMANALMPVQAEFYLMAVRAAQAAGLLPFDYAGDFRFRWLFCQSAGTPNMCRRTHVERQLSLDTGLNEQTLASIKARKIIYQGMDLYKQYMASHGTDKPWRPKLDDQDMTDILYPNWFFSDMDDSEVEI